METATDTEPLPEMDGQPSLRASGATDGMSTWTFSHMDVAGRASGRTTVPNNTSFITSNFEKNRITLARTSGRSMTVERANHVLAAQVAPPRAAFAMAYGSCSMQDWSLNRSRTLRIVSSEAFDIAVGIVIALNGIAIGVEIDWKSTENQAFFNYLEIFFLCLFTLELGMKMYVFRYKFFLLLIHWLDTGIVVLGLMAIALRLFISMQSAARQIQLFKFARLMRLVRLLRISTQFRPLWLLVQGLCNCVGPVLSTVTLVAANLYIFGVIAVEYVSSDPELQAVPWGRLGQTCGQKFANLPFAAFSLLELFAINEVAGEAFDVSQVQPMAIVFVFAFIFIVVVGMLNLFTGVLAENGSHLARHDEEHVRAVALADWQNSCDELEALFLEMTMENAGKSEGGSFISFRKSFEDTQEKITAFTPQVDEVRKAAAAVSGVCDALLQDPDAKLTMDQLVTLCSHQTVRERMNLLFAEPEGGQGGLKRLFEFWPLLDGNGDGVLSLQEFIEGLASLSQVIRNDLNKSYLWLNLFKEVRRTRSANMSDSETTRLSLMAGAMTIDQVREERRAQEEELRRQRRAHAQLRELTRRVQVMVFSQMLTEDKLRAIEGAAKAKAAQRSGWSWGLRRPRSAAAANRKSQASRRSKSR
mmetsp:Transcript_116131/g.339582  ORF Transcript_116131/g.339582 Transcript_116131/m.339582 type:complete len:644 (-) Transcript_116131:142-2073(-)